MRTSATTWRTTPCGWTLRRCVCGRSPGWTLWKRPSAARWSFLEQELRSTAQRVNLFEKVKIPEAKENIRVIGIYLGDQQTSAVVRGKIAKKKLQEVSR